jgi:uncharacterized protein involved in exopolysaccharide biosynthesis
VPVETRQHLDGLEDLRLVEAARAPSPVASAVRSHWWTALLPVVVLALAALAAALIRSPDYTAKARRAIGKLVPSDAAVLSSYTDATNTLAETYSRSIQADAIVGPTAQRLGVKPGWVRAGLSAAPIPATQVLAVSFVASSPSNAIKAANVAAAQLERYVRRIGVETTANNKLAEYRKAVERQAYLEAASGSLGTDPSARAKLETARLVTETAAQSYRNTQQGQTGVTDLRIIAPATAASSDRYSVLQILLLVGLAAGAAVGTALAVARSKGWQPGAPGVAR